MRTRCVSLSTHFFLWLIEDCSQVGEFAQDFVEARRDFSAWFGGDSPSDTIGKEMAGGHITTAGDRHGMPDIAGGAHILHGPIPELPELTSNGNGIHEKVNP